MAEPQRCSIPGCKLPAAAPLNNQSFCREHFILTCHARLDEYRRWLEGRLSRDTTAEAIRAFLTECTQRAVDLANHTPELSNLEQARLAYILMCAADLGRRLRRSPRKAASIAVRLRCERSENTWEEETETRVLSLRGALVKCQHLVARDETLLVERVDTGRQARARVAWQQRSKEGHLEIGIEFLDCENFWDVEWGNDQIRA